MSIFSLVAKMICQYGCDVKIINEDESIHGKAFVQPLRYKNRVYVGGRYHTLGLNKTDKYLLYGCRLVSENPAIDKYIANKQLENRVNAKKNGNNS